MVMMALCSPEGFKKRNAGLNHCTDATHIYFVEHYFIIIIVNIIIVISVLFLIGLMSSDISAACQRNVLIFCLL